MRSAVLMCLMAWVPCAAQTSDDDSAALALADRAEVLVRPAHAWKGFVEAAGVEASQDQGLPAVRGERICADVRYDGALATGVRGMASDRLDIDRFAGSAVTEVNTLREAYVSFTALPDALVDVGRINVRSGVGFGYNPTDFWRSDALRQIDSIDPDSLRSNRLGSVMVRAQTLWTSGSATLLASPRLARAPSDGAFDVDLGATNRENRWSLAMSQRLASDLTPQMLVYGDGEGSVQAGLNLTHLVNPATIAYLEWSGGRGSRLASGITYTTPVRLSVTVEFDLDSAAPGGSSWDRLRHGPVAAFQRYLEVAAAEQDLPTRHAAFGYAQIPDWGWRHLDVAAFSRLDLDDHSRLDWVEARYHRPTWDLAFQTQHESGSTRTAFGADPQRRVLQLLIDVFLP